MFPSLSQDIKIGIVGLGYVGLPLAIAFAEKYGVVGYDVDENRIKSLLEGSDDNRQLSSDCLGEATMKLTNDVSDLKYCQVYIITVPTPVNNEKNPDLSALLNASSEVGKLLQPGNVVIYESTVYPGCTEEDCVPVLEKSSGLRYNTDFFCGYSPERVSPGDHAHSLKDIVKVTSGSSAEAASFVDGLYRSIIPAGTHPAPSIRVAEASKAIENAQRDLNISFVNELALIFDRMGLDTQDVLAAARTKWNFLPFSPGLVGGHCISVDPYYLSYKAQELGYQPKVILSGREVNEYIPVFVANKVKRLLDERKLSGNSSSVLILGFTFKENCPDIRNTKVKDMYDEFRRLGFQVDVHDPVSIKPEVKRVYDIDLITEIDKTYDALVLAVAHDQFKHIDFEAFKKRGTLIFDTKLLIPTHLIDGRL